MKSLPMRWTLLLGAAVLFAVVALPAQQMVTETRDPEADAGRGLRQGGEGVDDAAVLHQPAGRSSAEGRRHPDRRRTCSAITSARRRS